MENEEKNQDNLKKARKEWLFTYWKQAGAEVKSTKVLAIAAMFIALRIAISSIYFTVPGFSSSRIYFSYIVVSIGGLIYGPVVGFWSGFVSDTAGYLIHPTGAYFFGYCLTSMVSGLLYGLFLYRKRITLVRLFCCKLTVNIVSNIFLNGLWSSILMGGYLFEVLIARVPKNLIMLPVEVALLYITFSVMLPILKRTHVLNYDLANDKVQLY